MKKSILKKIFIKISKFFGFELIDQNEFYSPTLGKYLDQELSTETKSIILPMGEVKITRKVSSLLIIFRCNTIIDIWDQNKKRLFEKEKKEYTLRSFNSLLVSISRLKRKNQRLKINLKIKRLFQIYLVC